MRWRWASICQLLLLLSSITIEANEDGNANNEDDNANNENDNANNEDDTEDGGDKDSNVTMGDGDKEAESNKTTMGCEVSIIFIIMCLLLAKRCPIMTFISNISPGTNWTQWNS